MALYQTIPSQQTIIISLEYGTISFDMSDLLGHLLDINTLINFLLKVNK
jgi:hypothetical protein